jgi:cytochrome P450
VKASAAEQKIEVPFTSDPASATPALRDIADLPSPPGIPWFGNALQLNSMKFHLTLEKWARDLGPMYRFLVGSRAIVVISDAAVIGNLLRERPESIRRPARDAELLAELGTTGVFSAEGEEWRKQRKLVMRALTPEMVKNFFPTLVAMTGRLQLRLQTAVREGRPVNLLRDLKAYTLDVTIALAMGQDINTLEHDDNPLQRDVETLFNRIARRVTTPIAYWRVFKLPADREAEASSARIAEAVAGFIAQTRARLAANPELRLKPTNLLEALVAARDEPDSGFTDTNVAGNAVTMVFAGEDTTSNTIAWLLNFVARDPRVASQLAAEADAVLPANADAQDDSVLQRFAALEEFPYLDAAMNEAMRLKPVAPILGMEPNHDMVVGGTLIKRGQLMIGLTRQAGRLPAEFPDMDAFRPERWLDASTLPKKDDPARKLFPFGGGQRFCPGRYLAMAEIKMVVSMMMRNFELTPELAAPPVQEVFTFTMTPSALPVRLALRAAAARSPQ